MIRILLVDDHPVVRQGIRTILLDRFRDASVAEAGDAHHALREVQGAEWDIVLLDISLPGPSGLDLIKHLRRHHPGLPLLVVSMHPAAQFARRALSAGALGYLTKDSTPEEFVAAIEQTRQGRRYVGRDASDLLLRWRGADASTPHDSLSDREYHQHLPDARAGQARHEEQRGVDAVRDREQPDGFVTTPVNAELAEFAERPSLRAQRVLR